MGVDHGGTGWTSPPQSLEWGVVPRFRHVAKFYAPDYLHYNVGKCVFFASTQQDFSSKSRHASLRIPVRRTGGN